MSSGQDAVLWREFRVLLDRVNKLEQQVAALRRELTGVREINKLWDGS